MHSRHTVPAVLVLVTILLMQTSVLHAENTIELRVNAGDTIEIGTDSTGTKPEFSWILTRDRKFQNAQRSRFFQTRFAQAGTYILDVSVQDPAGGANDYRAFTIIVADQPSSSPQLVPANLETTPLQAVLQSTSPIVDGKIYVPTDGGLIKIDPSLSAGKISSYDIDIDSTVDRNGDGNPTNDRDTADSLSSKTGSPIYLYVVPKPDRRAITLTVSSLTNPTPSTSSLEIAYGTAPASSTQSSSSVAVAVIENPGSPITIQKTENRVRLDAHLDADSTAGKELLYEWDFGDQTKSLLTSPTHTYASDGTYTITLTVRDISTGSVILTDVTSISIEGSPLSSSSSSTSSMATSVASSTSSSAQNSEGSSGSMGAILWVAGIMLLIFLLFLGLVGIILVVKSRFTGKLQDTLEKMEKTIVQKDQKQAILESKPEPMKLKKDEEQKETKKEAIIDQEKSRQEMKNASLRTNETPLSTSGPVPSWLAKSPNTPPAPSPAQNTPVHIANTKPLASTPVPAPVAPTPVTQPTPTTPASAPSWLKPSAPVARDVQKPPSPATSTTGPVPAWLEKKPNPDTATPTPASTPPVTQEVKPVTSPISTPPTQLAPTPVPPPPTPAPVVAPVQATPVAPVETPPVAQKTEPAPLAPSSEPKPIVTVPAEQNVITAEPAMTASDTTSTLATTKEQQTSPVISEKKVTEEPQKVVTPDKPDDDTPVAFIQADSLSKDA